ncbi:MAG: hypothetical protein AAFV53_02680 [Myxococcota bacterium]
MNVGAASIWTVLMLSGCAFGHRLVKLVTPATYVAPAPSGDIAVIEVEDPTGRRPYDAEPYDAEPYDEDMARPMIVSEKSTLHITPADEPVALRVYHRGRYLNRDDFQLISSVTGARDRAFPNEIRYLPLRLRDPYPLPISDLFNVYNNYRLKEGDLLLIEVSTPTATDRYLFIHRPVGLYANGTFDVLVRSNLPPDDEVVLSPAFAVGLAIGYRGADPYQLVTRIFDPLALQVTVGIGSSSLEAARAEEDLSALLNQTLLAALGGGGIRAWDTLSVQVLINLNGVFNPDISVAPTLGIGFDAARLTALIEDAFTKLLERNTLSAPPPQN